MNEKEAQKSIEYWSKHQELDKFNISQDTMLYVGYLALIISVSIISFESLKIAFQDSQSLKNYLAILIFIMNGFILLVFLIWMTKINRHNKHFISREIMIRYWYKEHFNVDIGGLDTKNGELMKLVSCYGRNVPQKLIDAIMKD